MVRSRKGYALRQRFDYFMESITRKSKWSRLKKENKLVKFRYKDRIINAPILIDEFDGDKFVKFRKYLDKYLDKKGNYEQWKVE